jgi:hypothetical protein
MKKIIILSVLIPSLSFADSMVIHDFATKSCNERNEYQVKVIEGSLKSFDKLMRDYDNGKITGDQASRSWERLMGEVSQANDKIKSDFEVKNAGASELFIITNLHSLTAKSGAIFTTLKELAGNKYNNKIIRDTFRNECLKNVDELTLRVKAIEERARKRELDEMRERMNARRAEADRELERMERESARAERQAERDRSERLLNQGLGILNQNNSTGVRPTGCFFQRESVSGFHKTCFYSCVTGVITSTVGSTEMCPPTR